jgi:predicted phosphate transport protein (TIGR00153 family)
MPRLPRIFAPREHEFFALFDEAAGNILRAAELLERMLRTYPEQGELARDILICEQDGDRITHDIIHRLNQTFVTPIDREDIYELASRLDDIVDYIEEVADFLGLYKIEAPMEQAQAMSRVLLDAARQLEQAMPRMRGTGSRSTGSRTRATAWCARHSRRSSRRGSILWW